MTRTRYYTATTIDGFIADEAGSRAWLFEVPASRGKTTAAAPAASTNVRASTVPLATVTSGQPLGDTAVRRLLPPRVESLFHLVGDSGTVSLRCFSWLGTESTRTAGKMLSRERPWC